MDKKGQFFFLSQFFMEDNRVKQPEWYEIVLTFITTCLYTLWDYRFAVGAQTTLITLTVMLLYYVWATIKKQTSSGNVETSHNQPTAYNNQMSIN